MNEHMHSHHQYDNSQIVDPVCGMEVRADSPHTLDHEGKTYRFCSSHCLEKFRADPAAYAGIGGRHNARPAIG